MKKTLLLAAYFLLSTVFSFSQNLVPNSSFEDTINCPSGLGDIIQANGWINSGYSPDYYNSCANTSAPSVGVPTNFSGKQTAFNGNAYAGITAWFLPGFREFIGVQLTQPLTLGTKYFTSAYITRADSGDRPPSTCACNKFGFRFSTIKYDYNQSTSAPVDNFSHVHSDSIITDKTNWTRIAGSFIADSSYKYLFIGNFYDDASTDTSACNYFQAYAYYYIDAVCVSADSLTCLIWTDVIESNAHSNEINIYPNPANSILNLGNINKEMVYSLTNIEGQNIIRGEINKQTNQIDISFIEEGIYFLNINMQHFKILIIH